MAGILGTSSSSTDVLELMLDRLHHRGPERTWMHRGTKVAIGCCVLSSEANHSGRAHSQMADMAVVIDGHLYSKDRMQLPEADLLISLYSRFGPRFVERLDGDFAFALVTDGESKSHFEIAALLASHLGISGFSDKTEEDWLREMVEESEIPDYDEFKQKGIYRLKLLEPYVAFKKQIEDPANNPFPTPSGKIEIYSQKWAELNHPEIPPIPKYIETWESKNDPLAAKYPLLLITTHFKRRANNQFDNIPWLRELEPQAVLINSTDAQARGISDGDMVWVFNDRGKMVIPAKVTERIMPGVVDVPHGAWYDPDENGVDRGGCANILTKDTYSPGGSFPYNTGLVQVKKA